MKRIQYHQYGGPEVMTLEEFSPSRPRTGEVLVRVMAAASNPMDHGVREGVAKILTGRSFPRGFGYDFAGVVEAIGADVSHLAIGDEVLGGASIKASGAVAEMVLASAKVVSKKPANLTFEEAATLPTVGLTALQALTRLGRLQAGQSVFVHGSLGGVGRAVVELALARGASVGGSSRASAHQEARELGIDPVVDFDVDPAALRAKFDVVIDTADTLSAATARALVKPGGRIVGIHPTAAAFARAAVPGPFRVLVTRPNTADLEQVAHAAGEGRLRVPIARTVPLSNAIAAITDFEQTSGSKGGKLVVTMTGATKS